MGRLNILNRIWEGVYCLIAEWGERVHQIDNIPLGCHNNQLIKCVSICHVVSYVPKPIYIGQELITLSINEAIFAGIFDDNTGNAVTHVEHIPGVVYLTTLHSIYTIRKGVIKDLIRGWPV